jgi:hypothetical protein
MFFISLPTVFRPTLGPTQSSNTWVAGALSLGVNWPRREAQSSSPTVAVGLHLTRGIDGEFFCISVVLCI